MTIIGFDVLWVSCTAPLLSQLSEKLMFPPAGRTSAKTLMIFSLSRDDSGGNFISFFFSLTEIRSLFQNVKFYIDWEGFYLGWNMWY